MIDHIMCFTAPNRRSRYPAPRHISIPLLLAALTLVSCGSAPIQVSPVVVEARTAHTELAHTSLNATASRTPPATSTQSTPDLTWLDTIHADFSTARELVERELDVNLADIRLQVVDDAPINAEVAVETERLIENQFGKSSFSDQFLDQIMHPLAGTYAALYSSRLGSVMISRSMLTAFEQSLSADASAQTRRAALLTLLIHELVHAADDQRYRIHDNRALNFRASFAQSATFEGHAQWVTRSICAQAGCSTGLQALDNFMFSTNESNHQQSQALEANSRSVLEYSYVEGERFVKGLAEREQGAALINELLSNPPLDPIQILAPETFPDTAREHRNQQLISASRSVDHLWASAPFIGVETSPLKGVDLRSDPSRRQAAVDGFTRLITSMVSMQFYNEQKQGELPIEATMLQAESAHTAQLFATMLHTNTQQSGARINEESMNLTPDNSPLAAPITVQIYRTAIDGDISYRTSVAVSGRHVVQVSGNTQQQSVLDDFAVRVLFNLEQPAIIANEIANEAVKDVAAVSPAG